VVKRVVRRAALGAADFGERAAMGSGFDGVWTEIFSAGVAGTLFFGRRCAMARLGGRSAGVLLFAAGLAAGTGRLRGFDFLEALECWATGSRSGAAFFLFNPGNTRFMRNVG
jgi:hypothetical protein